MKHAIILVAVAFFAAFSEAQGLNCYVCNDCLHVDGNTPTQSCNGADGLNFISTTTPPTPTPPTYAPIPPLTPPYPPNVGPQMLSNRKLRSLVLETNLADAVYQCYSVTAKNSSGSYVTKRGCVTTAATSSACDEIKQYDNDSSEICDVCSIDKCNSGTTLSVLLSLNLYAIAALIISKLV